MATILTFFTISTVLSVAVAQVPEKDLGRIATVPNLRELSGVVLDLSLKDFLKIRPACARDVFLVPEMAPEPEIGDQNLVEMGPVFESVSNGERHTSFGDPFFTGRYIFKAGQLKEFGLVWNFSRRSDQNLARRILSDSLERFGLQFKKFYKMDKAGVKTEFISAGICWGEFPDSAEFSIQKNRTMSLGEGDNEYAIQIVVPARTDILRDVPDLTTPETVKAEVDSLYEWIGLEVAVGERSASAEDASLQE